MSENDVKINRPQQLMTSALDGEAPSTAIASTAVKPANIYV